MFGIGGIIEGISNLASTWLEGRNQSAKAKLDLKMAEAENKARLLRDKESYNHSWEMATLTDKDRWLRRISFCIFFAPFFAALYSPHHVKEYFDVALAAVPTWWTQTCCAITGGIWGLSSLKNIAPSIINSFRKKPNG